MHRHFGKSNRALPRTSVIRQLHQLHDAQSDTLHNTNPMLHRYTLYYHRRRVRDRQMSVTQRFKLVFYVPPTALNACKTAIFTAGAGKYPGPGGYTECAFMSKGTGQFKPGDSANPHVRVFHPSLFVW
jgi:hypothetical protein